MKSFKEYIEESGDTDHHKYSKNTIEELELLLKHHIEDVKEYEDGDEGEDGCNKETLKHDVEEIRDAIKIKKAGEAEKTKN